MSEDHTEHSDESSSEPQIRHNSANEDLSSAPYAGFWIRFFAVLIDGVILSGISLILTPFTEKLMEVFIGTMGLFIATGVVLVFSLIPSFFYYVLPLHLYGKTIGKKIMGLKVIDSRSFNNVSLIQAFCREFPGKIISGLILGIGYFMVAFDDRKQALHDKMCSTIVVKEVRS